MMMKKILVILGGVLLLLTGAAVAALFLLEPERIIAERKDALAGEVSETLGRKLEVGAIVGSVLPTLSAEVRGVTLGGPEGASEPQLSVGKVVVRIGLWRALTSFGSELEVQAIEIDDVTLRAARDAGGRWDFQDILDRLAAAEAEAPPSAAGEEGPTDLSFLEGARLTHLALRNLEVRIDDAMLGRPLAVEQTSLELSNIQLGAPIEAALRATLVDGESRAPVSVDLRLSELRRDLSFDPLPELSVDLRAGPLALGPWGGLLPADSLAPAEGTLEVRLGVAASAGLKRASLEGELKLAALRLKQGAARGAPLDLTLGFDLAADLEAPRYELRRLEISGGGLEARGGLVAHGLSPAALERSDLSLKLAALEPLLAVLPAGAGLLPPELELAGPVSAAIEADGKTVGVRVDLDAATVGYGEVFHKRAGRPLHLSLAGKLEGERLKIPDLRLAVDEARMKGSLELGTTPGAPMSAALSTGPVSLASLRELLPPVAEGLAGGRKVAGGFELTVQADAVGARQKAHVELTLKELDLDLPELGVKGSGRIVADAAPGETSTALSLNASLDGLALRSRDEAGEVLLDKPAGQPLELVLQARQQEEQADLEKLSATIGRSRIRGSGKVSGLSGPSPTYQIQLSELALAFDDLRRSVPGAAALPPGGRLEGSLRLDGQPDLPKTMRLDFTLASLIWGHSRMQGTLGLTNPEAPDFRCDLKSSYLDVDELLGEEEEAPAEAATPATAGENPHGLDAETRGLLSTVNGQCALSAERARFQGMEMKRFVGRLSVRRGVVTFEALDFELWGGRISAGGTTFDLPAEHTGYTLALKVDDVDLGQALAGRGKLAGSVRGVTDQDVKLKGRGLSAADLGRSATGLVGLETTSLELTSLDVLGAVSAPLLAGMAKAGLGKAKPLALSTGGSGGTILREVKTALAFDAGKFTLQKKLRSPTRFGAMELEGGGSLKNEVDLRGTALIDPEIVNRAVGRQVVTEAVPVPLKIGGTWDRPKITGVEVGPLLKKVALGAGAAALGAAAPGLDDKARDAKAELDARKRAAQEEARQQAEAARQRAQQAREKAEADAKAKAAKLEAEARARKAEAEKKLKEEAEKKKKEAAQKAKKLLGF
ncbi:MAG: AsmA family protein [Deltaproteobacteria bacterium]|nr:AsmA family protein [Deltaproteobacteria bacterium]